MYICQGSGWGVRNDDGCKSAHDSYKVTLNESQLASKVRPAINGKY